MLKKEFKRKDVQRVRNLVRGKTDDATGIQIGYKKELKEQKKRKKVTEDTKAMKKYLEDKAEKLKKKREKQSDAAMNNPHFDSTQPSPSGKSMNEMMTAKKPKTKMNPKNMTKPANQPYTALIIVF